MRRSILITVILLIIIGGGSYYYFQKEQAKQQPVTLYGNVDIRTTALSFRVGGRLKLLNVDEGDTVQKGQFIGEIDPQPYQIALAQAKAQSDAAKANLDLLKAGYRSEEIARAREQVKQLTSAYQYAQRSYERYRVLRLKKAIAQEQLDAAKDKRDQAQADLLAAQQQLAQYQQGNRPQQIEQAQAQFEQAQAGVAKAQLDLNDTQLKAPADGTILVRAHQPGAMLNPGTTVFTLALSHPLWIKAYIDEPHLSMAQSGRKVTITSDSSKETFHGHIGFVSPTAEFTPKTVQTEQLRTSLVYRLRIIVDDPSPQLRQGMPVTIHFAK